MKNFAVDEKNHSKVSHLSPIYHSEPDLHISIRQKPTLSLVTSPDSASSRNFGNSSRFYKALKDFQQTSDPTVLKEELWTNRKEITRLEKIITEKDDEIRELKMKNKIESNQVTQKSKKYEENDSEVQYLKQKISDLEKICNFHEYNLKKSKSLFEFYTKKIIFGVEDFLAKAMLKINQSENKFIYLFQNFYERQQDVKRGEIKYEAISGSNNESSLEKNKEIAKLSLELDEINKELQGRINELNRKNSEIQEKNQEIHEKNQENSEKMKEINRLKSETVRSTNIYEKSIETLEKKNEELYKKNEDLHRKLEELLEKIKTLNKENKLLNELNQEIENENTKMKHAHQNYKLKIQELKNSLLKQENKSLKSKNSTQKEEIGNKIYEKYKTYKRKYKILAKSENELRNCYKECEEKTKFAIQEYNNLIKEIEKKNETGYNKKEFGLLNKKLEDSEKRNSEILEKFKEMQIKFEEKCKESLISQEKMNDLLEKIKDLNEINEKLECELEKSKENCMELADKYENSQKELETALKLKEICDQLNEKIIDLDAGIVISYAKVQKYKKKLVELNVLSSLNQSSSEDNITDQDFSRA